MKKSLIMFATTVSFALGILSQPVISTAQDILAFSSVDAPTEVSDENSANTMDLNSDGKVDAFDLVWARKSGNPEIMRQISDFVLGVIPSETTSFNENLEAKNNGVDYKDLEAENNGVDYEDLEAENNGVDYEDLEAENNGVDYKENANETTNNESPNLEKNEVTMKSNNDETEVANETLPHTNNPAISVKIDLTEDTNARIDQEFYSNLRSELRNYTVSSVSFSEDGKVEITCFKNNISLTLVVWLLDMDEDSGAVILEYENSNFDFTLYASYNDGRVKITPIVIDGKKFVR